MELRIQTCCFTGHREVPTCLKAELKCQTKGIILGLLASGVRFFGAGGALGYDTIAAESVLEVQKSHPQIRLILVLPCPDQTKNWQLKDIERYDRIKALANKVVYISEHYTQDCMFRRNRHLVDSSSVCVAYCTRSTGGAAYTVDYAQKKGLQIIRPVL